MSTTLKCLSLIDLLVQEMEEEALTTRKMLNIVPADQFDWRPHPKSMSLKQLATHVAELPGWIDMTFTTSELDFATTPYTPVPVSDTQDLLDYFEKSLKKGLHALRHATEDQLQDLWTLRNGDTVYSVRKKVEVVRMTFCQIVHHRAQLGVFLRLLNIPIPGSYGPSADEMPLK